MSVLADPARSTDAALAELDRAISRARAQRDPTAIERVATSALFVDRARPCHSALWQIVENGRAGGAVTSAVNAAMVLWADDYHSGQWASSAALTAEGQDLSGATGSSCTRHRCATAPGSWPPRAASTSAPASWRRPSSGSLRPRDALGPMLRVARARPFRVRARRLRRRAPAVRADHPRGDGAGEPPGGAVDDPRTRRVGDALRAPRLRPRAGALPARTRRRSDLAPARAGVRRRPGFWSPTLATPAHTSTPRWQRRGHRSGRSTTPASNSLTASICAAVEPRGKLASTC